MIQEIAGKLRIRKVQKCLERLLIGIDSRIVALVEVRQQKFIEFPHAAPALPAKSGQ